MSEDEKPEPNGVLLVIAFACGVLFADVARDIQQEKAFGKTMQVQNRVETR